MNSQFLVAKNRFVKRFNKKTKFNDLVKIKNIHIRMNLNAEQQGKCASVCLSVCCSVLTSS